MRFDPKAATKKEVRIFEHDVLGTIEYVLPTVNEQISMSKMADSDGVKMLVFTMLSPCNPDLLLSDMDDMDSLTFKHLSDFVAKVLDFRGETKN